MQALLDWLNSRTGNQRRQLAIGAVVGALLLGFWFSNQQGQVVPTDVAPPTISLPTSIRVHVVGEVLTPGLYELPIGSIANDAIEQAGGFSSQAAQESVNLARVLADGEQLIVLNIEQVVVGSVGSKISINRAGESEFDSLPGIGPALATRIIDHRAKVGGFKSIEELTAVSGIGAKLFEQIRDQLTL